MCAIIGAVISRPTRDDFAMVKRVFLESKIRGMHATGMSFLPAWSNKVVTIKEPKPADYFVDVHLHDDNLSQLVSDDGNLYLVGHCRYSTSDLEYNQPISNENVSVVHNGVVSQELPENWESLYGYKCETKNDTELLLHTIEEGASPLTRWSDASLSVVELYLDKRVRAYRNGKRPIYMTTLENGFIFTSTQDIVTRARVEGATVELDPFVYAEVLDPYTVMFEAETPPVNFKDLQQ
jgi:asparagine synthetase B (glutamine-hydrolysing)